MRTRRRINKQLCQSPTDSRRRSLNARLVEIERKLKQSYHKQQEAQEQRAVNNIKRNHKYIYSYAKSISTITIGVGPLLSSAKTLISDPHFDLVTRLMEEGKYVDDIYLDFSKAFDKVDIGVTLRKLKSMCQWKGRKMAPELPYWLSAVCSHQQRTVRRTTSAIGSSSRFGPRTAAVPWTDLWHRRGCSLIVPVKFCWWHQNHARYIQPRRHWSPETRHPCCLSVGKKQQFGVQFRQIRTPKVFPLRISPNWNNLSGRHRPGNWSEIQPSWHGSHYEWWRIVLHIHQGKISAMKLKVGWVIRTFKRGDTYLMLTLWKQLNLSDHGYCSQLWNPHKVGDIQSLDLLQRSFLSKISGMHHFSSWDQLKEWKLYSLERRRERYIAIYVWRILEGSAPNISDSHGISFKWHPRRGRVCIVPPSHLVLQLAQRLSDLPHLQSRDL